MKKIVRTNTWVLSDIRNVYDKLDEIVEYLNQFEVDDGVGDLGKFGILPDDGKVD